MRLAEDKRLDYRNELKEFINSRCIFRCNPDVQYMPGIPKGTIPGANPNIYSPWQMYLRNLTHDARASFLASRLIIDMMVQNDDFFPFQMAGLETSSTPLLTAIQSHIYHLCGKEVNVFSVRKERKKYGLFNFIDGRPNKLPVVLIDDIFNSGSAASRVLDTILYEYDLDPYHRAFYLIRYRDSTLFPFNGVNIELNSIFHKTEFDFRWSPENDWLPFDCDKQMQKRPDYA